MPVLELVILGTGGGATTVYHQEPSSSFVLLLDGRPVLLADCGFGVVSSCLEHAGTLPDNIYISHNHSDHAGELSVMLAVESGRQHRMCVLSHPDVQQRLQQHRLHELMSTGKQLDDFAVWQPCPESHDTHVTPDLTLRPVRSRHGELCFGAVFKWKGKHVLGWSADSGCDDALYSELSQADCLLVDARAQGTAEHAGFEEVVHLARGLVPQGKQVFMTGYGRQSEAPTGIDLGGAAAVYPGLRITLQTD